MGNGLQVREEKYLDVNHEGKTITFVLPSLVEGSFADVGRLIDRRNLTRPTFSQIVSLVYAAHQNLNSPNEYSKEIIDCLKRNFMWGFTGVLGGKDGFYMQDLPNIGNITHHYYGEIHTDYDSILMDESELVKKLESGDPGVRFVQYNGFRRGQQSGKKLAKNKFIIALASEEGAEKLAEIAGIYPRKPYLIMGGEIPTLSIPDILKPKCCNDRLFIDLGLSVNKNSSNHQAWHYEYLRGFSLGLVKDDAA